MSQVTAEELDRAVEGQTVPSRFARTVADHGDITALRWRNEDESWGELTFRQYAEQACRVAAGLREMGVTPGDRVVLMMRNRPEFHITDMGTMPAGATPISIYNSSAPEQVEYLVGHSEAKVAVVEDIGFLERFLKVRSELPAMRTIVLLEDPDGLAPDDVVAYSQFTGACRRTPAPSRGSRSRSSPARWARRCPASR